MSVSRIHETEKGEKKLGKKKKPKKKERLEEEAEEEAGEEVEGGWEKVKGGAPLVKVKKICLLKAFSDLLQQDRTIDGTVIYFSVASLQAQKIASFFFQYSINVMSIISD